MIEHLTLSKKKRGMELSPSRAVINSEHGCWACLLVDLGNQLSIATKTDMQTNRATGRCCGISFAIATSATIAPAKMRERSMGWMRETDRW
jgi:hypothetical protein